MTGNMRELGVQLLDRVNDACRHAALLDVSSYSGAITTGSRDVA
jgi:hypothetical protein